MHQLLNTGSTETSTSPVQAALTPKNEKGKAIEVEEPRKKPQTTVKDQERKQRLHSSKPKRRHSSSSSSEERARPHTPSVKEIKESVKGDKRALSREIKQFAASKKEEV